MIHPDYNSPAALKAFLDENGMAMQKKFGQNFLVNRDARTRLIDALDIQDNTNVWEVGPGLGCMTEEILKRGADLTVFEIDRGFASLLKDFFDSYSKKKKFRIVEGDVLKTWKKQLEEQGEPSRFFGNLPYNIAATIIADTVESGIRFEKAVVTVQKEVAQRMTAEPDTEDYSSFSILCRWAYDVKPLVDLAGGNFWPRPNVDSRAVVLTRKKDFPCCKNPAYFMKMERSLFVSRRKNIKNNLTTFFSDPQKAEMMLNKAGIDPTSRAESIPIEKLLLLSDISNPAII